MEGRKKGGDREEYDEISVSAVKGCEHLGPAKTKQH